MPNFNYDVALSFLAKDEGLAGHMSEVLGERYEVFFYSERQKELAGRDGMDAFSNVFERESRMVVVLHRDGWGGTPWTGVEETAVKNRAFDNGWEFLLFISVDGSPPPAWLPRTKIWFGLEKYGVDAGIAVIDARLQELGVSVRVETPVLLASRKAAERARQQETERVLRSERGVKLARESLAELFSYLKGQVEDIRPVIPSVAFFTKSQDTVALVRTDAASVTFGWFNQYRNSLDRSSLLIREFDGPYSFDGRGHGPNVLGEATVHFTLDPAGSGIWYDARSDTNRYTSRQLADTYLKRLIERM